MASAAPETPADTALSLMLEDVSSAECCSSTQEPERSVKVTFAPWAHVHRMGYATT
jgi:hypothetical protein